ncbi:hypothetical protein EV356DRAFT_392206 [Viridothelium virens]|uniref:Uncharacterized protein n=1 Tax=Viridothelium virens TaxID=1048519 RepID=A0A6A6GUE7_VIRVR|nr:hypothetical protein EV356DRAFT_392206 [Viridothelium virens]
MSLSLSAGGELKNTPWVLLFALMAPLTLYSLLIANLRICAFYVSGLEWHECLWRNLSGIAKMQSGNEGILWENCGIKS